MTMIMIVINMLLLTAAGNAADNSHVLCLSFRVMSLFV